MAVKEWLVSGKVAAQKKKLKVSTGSPYTDDHFYMKLLISHAQAISDFMCMFPKINICDTEVWLQSHTHVYI